MTLKKYVAGFMFRGTPSDPSYKEVLLILKDRPSWQKGLLNAVGGKVEPGETPHTAMRREFLEEAGVETTIWQWREFCTLEHHQYGGHVTFFAAEWREEMGHPRSVESEPVRWYHVKEVLWPEYPVMSNLMWLIPLALAPKGIMAKVVDRSVV